MRLTTVSMGKIILKAACRFPVFKAFFKQSYRVIIFLIVGFSGCIQNNEDQLSDDGKFELVSYSVESWKSRNEEVYKGENMTQMVHIEKKIADGFNYNESIDEYRIE